jgi:hypothetical protein
MPENVKDFRFINLRFAICIKYMGRMKMKEEEGLKEKDEGSRERNRRGSRRKMNEEKEEGMNEKDVGRGILQKIIKLQVNDKK